MTKNMGRFTTDKKGFCIIDFVGNKVWEGKYSDETKSLCNQLNNLCNENRELKAENKQLKQQIKELKKDVDALSCGEADWLIEEEL